jgi:hypothetical protein
MLLVVADGNSRYLTRAVFWVVMPLTGKWVEPRYQTRPFFIGMGFFIFIKWKKMGTVRAFCLKKLEVKHYGRHD